MLVYQLAIKASLCLNISDGDNALSFDLALEVAPFFRRILCSSAFRFYQMRKISTSDRREKELHSVRF